MTSRLGTVIVEFRAAFRNRELRRVGLAYSLFGAAEFGTWITLLVFAYGHGGASTSTLMVIVQVIPCMAIGPFVGALADRRRPSRVLCAAYAVQALSLGAMALSMGLGAPALVVFVLAPLTSLSLSVSRPPQAALLPAIVRTPDELIAANVMTGWTYAGAALVGPALAGVLLGWRGPGLAVAAMAAMAVVATVLVAPVAGPAAAISSAIESEHVVSVGKATWGNVSVALHNRQIRVLLVLHTFYYVLIGALDVLCVVLALNYLHIGSGGPGFLNAALGGGALLSGFVTVFVVGRRHLARTLTVALLLAVVALALIGALPNVAPVIVLIGTVGLAGAVFEVTGHTLLQRSAPSDAIAGSFSILEALMDFGLALGAVLVRIAIGIGGVKAALFAPAVVAVVVMALLWSRLSKIDSSATVPQVEIQLLRSISIFAALPAPALEAVARDLEPLAVAQGTVVITQGEPGDCYYAVAGGELTICRDDELVGLVSRGQGFGELALIRDIPRQATVTASTDASLFTLHKEPFVRAVTGHATATRAVTSIVTEYLGDETVDGSD